VYVDTFRSQIRNTSAPHIIVHPAMWKCQNVSS